MIPCKRTFGNTVNIVRIGVCRCLVVLRSLAIVAQHGTERDTFLGDKILSPLAGRTVNLGTAVVAHEHLVVGGHPDTETGAEDESDEVMVLLHPAGLANLFVKHRQRTGQCLAISEQVCVIVDKYRQPERILQKSTQRHTALKAGEIGETVGENAVRIVCRTRKRETDGHRFVRQLVDDMPEARPQIPQ